MLILELDNKTIIASAQRFALSSNELARANALAVNDVARDVRGKKRTEFKAHLTLPSRSITERVELVKRASAQKPEAVVSVERRARDGGQGGNARPSLMSFAGSPNKPRREAKRTKRGKLTKSGRRLHEPFGYQIKKGGTRKLLPGGFVQRPRRRFNLNGGTYEDLTGEQRAQALVRRGPKRYPTLVPRGPSLSAVYQSDDNDIRQKVVEDARGQLAERSIAQSRRIYERRWRKVSS